MRIGLQTLILLIFAGSIHVGAQTKRISCSAGMQAPPYGFWNWPANTQIRVYILSTDFEPEEIPYLLKALRNWDNALKATSSVISVKYEGTTSTTQYSENCLTITRGEVFSKNRHNAAELRGYSAYSNQILTHAAIVIDRRVTNLQMLSSVVAHEFGHSLGLLDCYSCPSGSTVMAAFKGINISNGIEGPTDCDIAQVTKTYGELRNRPRSSRVAAKKLVDEGEEPVEDDSPIVMPKP